MEFLKAFIEELCKDEWIAFLPGFMLMYFSLISTFDTVGEIVVRKKHRHIPLRNIDDWQKELLKEYEMSSTINNSKILGNFGSISIACTLFWVLQKHANLVYYIVTSVVMSIISIWLNVCLSRRKNIQYKESQMLYLDLYKKFDMKIVTKGNYMCGRKINIRFFEKEGLMDSRAVGRGVYAIELRKADNNNKRIVLYIGESENMIARCSKHLHTILNQPIKWGLLDSDLDDESLEIFISEVEFLGENDSLKTFEKSNIENIKPILQRKNKYGKYDAMIPENERSIKVREAINNLKAM